MGNGNGKFIVVEGPDGVGKSTSVQFVASHLRATTGAEVICTRLPGGTPAGERIRAIFKERATSMPLDEQIELLITAKHHLIEQVIKPAIAEGAYVIADRYVDSLMAYQWAGFSNFNLKFKEQIESRLLLERIDIFPDLKIVMECPVEVAERRMGCDNRATDALDSASPDFKRRVRTYFEHFLVESPHGHTFRVDSSGDVRSVEKQLMAIMANVL